ncbi:MAG: BrnA antitoxin family protein [Planctomycetes bacterium]|jgi:hypothetical protein|nr:BrnA antitoxin family protein [Planctomycetota bacterium]
MSQIPVINSIEELAKFWDTHDVTDFAGELEEVREPAFERGAEAVVHIRLDSAQAQALRRMARARGMEAAKLVEEWVNERLRASR